jgi:hypothetical protein
MSQARSTDPPIDPRSLRFAAWVTTAVLVLVLVTGSAVLLAAQAVVFAIGTFAGLQLHPYGVVHRAFVAPRLAPSTPRPARRVETSTSAEWEDSAPVRFAQGVGLAFAAIGTIGYATGLTALGVTATALALGAAFLNAAFGWCLGCEIYLRLPAAWRGRRTPVVNEANTKRGAAT